MAIQFSKLAQNLNASEIRELLKLTELPEIISFAGGLPAAELFPIEAMKKVDLKILEDEGAKSLQYGPTDGYIPLRNEIAARMNKVYCTNVTADDILITSGSQQGLDTLGRIFCDEGDIILMESPSYLGAINAFKLSGANFIGVPTDSEGMIPAELDRILSENDRVRAVYVIPDFQNPTGITWSEQRRHDFMTVVNKYNVPVIEDDPYGELRFEGKFLPALKSLDTKDLVIFLGTFSKILTPGLRLGWVCANPEVLDKCNKIKQSADLHTSSFGQRQAAYFIKMFDLDAHVKTICQVYGKRRTSMINAMDNYFPKEATFTRPEGGLFTWVVLPEYMDSRELMKECVAEKVAFVPGGSFFPNGGHNNTFRLNYSNMDEERIEIGIKRIADVIKKHIK